MPLVYSKGIARCGHSVTALSETSMDGGTFGRQIQLLFINSITHFLSEEMFWRTDALFYLFFFPSKEDVFQMKLANWKTFS